MDKKLVIAGIFILFAAACSKYGEFDGFYQGTKYIEAYNSLDKITEKQTFDFESRMIKVVLRLALEGDMDFITNKLAAVITNTKSLSLSNYIRFGKVFLYYCESEKRSDQKYYQEVTNLLKIVPGHVPDEFLAQAYQIKGIANYKMGQFKPAIADLEQSYKVFPLVDNLYFISQCYYAMDDADRAVEYLDKVIHIANDEVLISLALYHKGEIFYNKDDYNTALSFYLEAVKYYCNNSDYNYKVAKCFQKLGYEKIYSKFLKTCLRIDENFATAYFYLSIN
ncbi:MAG: tetratricopeptide repeat protein [Brevinematales bacterium]|nr:tetratricopeptide repeat protein [Brevinematales bacterium]